MIFVVNIVGCNRIQKLVCLWFIFVSMYVDVVGLGGLV